MINKKRISDCGTCFWWREVGVTPWSHQSSCENGCTCGPEPFIPPVVGKEIQIALTYCLAKVQADSSILTPDSIICVGEAITLEKIPISWFACVVIENQPGLTEWSYFPKDLPSAELRGHLDKFPGKSGDVLIFAVEDKKPSHVVAIGRIMPNEPLN